MPQLSQLCCTNYLHQHIQWNHPRSFLSPSPPNDDLNRAAAAYASRDMDEYTEIQRWSSIVFSFRVGYCTLYLSVLGINDQLFSCLVDGLWKIFHHLEFTATGLQE